MLILVGAVTLMALPTAACAQDDNDGGDSGAAEAAAEATSHEPDAPASTDADESAPTVRVERPIELKPYDVLISVSFENDAAFPDLFRDDVLTTAKSRLRARLGQMWNTAVREDRFLSPPTRRTLDRWTSQQLNDLFLPGEHDKVFLVGVNREGSRFRLFAREWDRNSRTSGASTLRETFDQRLIGDLLAEVVLDVFRPLAMIHKAEDDVIELGIRGGEFPPADPSAAQFQPDDYLLTYMRYLDRERNVQQVQFVPWTYLRVDSVERARMLCHVVSAFRSPLIGSRRRVELMAITARPLLEETRLTLTPRRDPLNPLIAHRVDVLDRLPTEEDPVLDRLSLLSDRQGTVTLPADPSNPLRHLLVHSGQEVLARAPFIAGLEREVTLELPDDSPRLTVEAELDLMRDDLIDTVASRAVIMARARRAARTENWDEVDRFLDDLAALPDLEDFEERLAAVRVPAEQRARRMGDRVAQSRIARMCREFGEIAAEHLAPDILRDFRTEMNELRAASR